jgi:hypothetical protein
MRYVCVGGEDSRHGLLVEKDWPYVDLANGVIDGDKLDGQNVWPVGCRFQVVMARN